MKQIISVILAMFFAHVALAEETSKGSETLNLGGGSKLILRASNTTGGAIDRSAFSATRYDSSGNIVAFSYGRIDSWESTVVQGYTDHSVTKNYRDGSWEKVTTTAVARDASGLTLRHDICGSDAGGAGKFVAIQVIHADGSSEFSVTDQTTGETRVIKYETDPVTGKSKVISDQRIPPSSGKGSSKGENGPTAGPMPSAGVSPGLTQELQRDKLR